MVVEIHFNLTLKYQSISEISSICCKVMSTFVLKKLKPNEFYDSFLTSKRTDNHLRPDEVSEGYRRDKCGYRPCVLTMNPYNSNSLSKAYCSSSAMLNMGNTSVVCGINFSVGTPDVAFPDIGEVSISVTDHNTAYTSHSIPLDPNSNEHTEFMEGFLLELLCCSKCLDLKRLCVRAVSQNLKLDELYI